MHDMINESPLLLLPYARYVCNVKYMQLPQWYTRFSKHNVIRTNLLAWDVLSNNKPFTRKRKSKRRGGERGRERERERSPGSDLSLKYCTNRSRTTSSLAVRLDGNIKPEIMTSEVSCPLSYTNRGLNVSGSRRKVSRKFTLCRPEQSCDNTATLRTMAS